MAIGKPMGAPFRTVYSQLRHLFFFFFVVVVVVTVIVSPIKIIDVKIRQATLYIGSLSDGRQQPSRIGRSAVDAISITGAVFRQKGSVCQHSTGDESHSI